MRYQVFVSCLDRRHAFQTAMAAAEAGVLDTFVTGAYYDRRQLPHRLLPAVSGGDALATTVGSRVRAVPRFLLPGKALTRVRWVRNTPVPAAAYLAGEVAFDAFVARTYQGSDVFHGFGRYSPDSLARARSLGALTVLDAFELHPAVELERENRERERMGLAPARVSPIRRRSIERRLAAYEHADVIFACLDDVRRTLVDEGIPPERIRVVPLGGAPSVVPANAHPVADGRPFRLLYVGQLHWFKGLHLLLDAWARLRLPEAELVIVGRAFPDWKDYFADRFARTPQVRWIDGLPNQQLLDLYGEVDALAFPSLVGGVGMVVYEAMACGLPVLVSSGDVVIRPGVDGLVVPPDDAERFDAALLSLYADRELRVALGAAGRERVGEFTWERYRGNVVSEYETALGQMRTGRA